MDPATTKVILGLHREDLNAALQSLSKTSPDDREGVAFAAFRDELMRGWNKLHDAVFTLIIVREDNAVREAFTQHSSEAQQTDRNYEMACRLVGLPVPQRPVVSNDHGAHRIAIDKQFEGANGMTPAQKPLCFRSVGTQSAPTKTKPPAGNSWWPALSLNSFKRARVEDADDEDKNSFTPHANGSTVRKRYAYIEPAALREKNDGRTKRTKLELQASTTPIDATVSVASSDAINKEGHGLPAAGSGAILSHRCSACSDMHPIRNTIQLQCKNAGDAEAHAYCRDCLIHLFEACITDSSQFPPRCCDQILPVFACIPFLPPTLFARFVARREELETPNRTYCSNVLCSEWIRPVNIVANVATCPTCIQTTCETCKRGQHEGLCQDDMDVKKLMDVAKEKQWQTCPNCNEMVELKVPANIAAPNVVNPANIVQPAPPFFGAPVPANNAPIHVANSAYVVPPVLPFAFAPAVYAPVPNTAAFRPQYQAQVQFQPFGQHPQQQHLPQAGNNAQDYGHLGDDHEFRRLYKSKGVDTESFGLRKI
ncbi:hypothetical protein J4E91_002294 [Alternaria rosae]|nr:hypothetical protein J4E91_002294 [Alternaria rosae]